MPTNPKICQITQEIARKDRCSHKLHHLHNSAPSPCFWHIFYTGAKFGKY